MIEISTLIRHDASLIVQSENEIHNSRKGTNNDPYFKKKLLGDATIGSTYERVEFND